MMESRVTRDDKANTPTPPAPPLMYNGIVVRPGRDGKDPTVQIKMARALKLRDDDILIAAYPKCGTHWVSEIVNMLLNGSVSYAKLTKESTMLEYISDLSVLDKLDSPRVLNSHYFFGHLPNEEILQRKVKIIHLIRNPKDTAISYYHFTKQFLPDEDKIPFDVYLQQYMDRVFRPHHQFDYLKQVQEFERANPDHPIKHVHYEDLKLDPLPVVRSVAEFLGVPANDDFYTKVIDACGFQNLKKNDEGRGSGDPVDEKYKGMVVYRKGIIGDWKNSFTVAQNEAFDEFISKQVSGIDVTFRGL